MLREGLATLQSVVAQRSILSLSVVSNEKTAILYHPTSLPYTPVLNAEPLARLG